jgi:Putative beta barrel porin-7 (BBP7)
VFAVKSQIFRVAVSTLFVASIVSSVANAAELRTSSASRPVLRTVSFQEALETPEIIDSILEDDSHLSPCELCGVAGCDSECLTISNIWASVDYLLWWRRGQSFPALVTTSPAGTAQGVAGVLPNATALFGSETIGEEARPGARISLGGWLNDQRTIGVEGRFFALGEERIRFGANSVDFPILARPFRDPVGATQEATLLAFPGFTGPGNVDISGKSDVYGGDFLFRWRAAQSVTSKMDVLVGYQFSRIDEDFNINSFTTAINVPGIDAGTTFTTSEQFYARNEFHAGQIGLSTKYVNHNWTVDILTKIAFGNMREVVTIGGQTTIVTPGPGGGTSTSPGPLAGAANSGRYSNNKFAVSPELAVNCRYAITEQLDIGFGYSFIYWSNVAQAGKQIDSQLNDPPSAFSLNSDSYWVHGLNVGANFKF